jgi:hypothetical protein
MTSLSIFANFRIDSEERLQRMKDSFMSFKDINPSKWIINARGDYKKQAMDFLSDHLGSRLISFELESEHGWFHDSRIMLREIESDFVFYWIEDHINLVTDYSLYAGIIDDMKTAKIEFLPYSFFWTTKRYELIETKEMTHFLWLDLNIANFQLLQKKAPFAYIIFCVGIFSKELFQRIILDDDDRQAIKWPKETPFNFEKSSRDIHWLPIRIGLPKFELFASIDDDSVAPGSSLISRGLYDARKRRKAMACPDDYRPL